MGKKGSMSITHRGRKNYTTKKGDKVFHQTGHFLKKTFKPFSYRKGSRSKTNKGFLDFVFRKNTRKRTRKMR